MIVGFNSTNLHGSNSMIQNMHINKQNITKGPKPISKWLQYSFHRKIKNLINLQVSHAPPHLEMYLMSAYYLLKNLLQCTIF